MKLYLRNLVLPILLSVFAMPAMAISLQGMNETASGIGYKVTPSSDAVDSLSALIGGYINIAISLLGMVFMVLIWMGAFDIIGAGGNDEVVKKGRARIKNGAIGILIILAAYFITKLIFFIVSGTGYFNSTDSQATSLHGLINYLVG